MVQKYIPLASKLNGAVNTKLKLKGRLKNDMMPELTTISAYGLLLSDVIGIKDINTFNRISDALKIDKLRNPSLQKVNLSFDILDGKATVKPMDFKLGGYNANFSGTTSLDQTLNFILNLEIPRSDFGAKANGVLNKMVAEASGKGVNINLGDIVPVTILIGGTASDPKITTGIKNAMSNLVEDIKNQAVAQIEKKKEELVAKAKQEATSLITKADAEAAKLIAEAEKQSQKIIQAAAATAQKVRFVADSTASRVVAEGKKNGYIAEIAAKKAAEKVKKEGYDKAVRIETEATKQSNAVLEHARAEAEKLNKEALDRVK
jgi:hypothetical protein